MKYFSTRGAGPELSFEEAVLAGLAPDGGLFVPAHVPALPAAWRTAWAPLSFAQLAAAVLALYIAPAEISRAELGALAERAYAPFRAPAVAPLRRLADGRYVLELWHGPTYAFKDVALQLLGLLFEFFLARRNAARAAGAPRARLTVVGATSGDTGSAAICGLRGKADIAIFILHPKGRVSPVQEAQMTTVADANVHNVAVRGTFDDCQDIVKALFADREFNAAHSLGAVNSINWARILAQTVYYFTAYFALQRASGEAAPRVQFVVPTGNFGDALAGFYARRMGLPAARLAVATNANDILARFWRTGAYAPPAGGAAATLSPAMDILVSSNFERLLWHLASDAAPPGAANRAEACAAVARWMAAVKADGRVALPADVLRAARADFVAARVSDEETLESIRATFAESRYVADPHTAVGLAAARLLAADAAAPEHAPQPGAPPVTQIVLSTAHPAKFSDAVSRALCDVEGFDFDRDVLPDEFREMLKKPRRVIDVDTPTVAAVKKVIESAALAAAT